MSYLDDRKKEKARKKIFLVLVLILIFFVLSFTGVFSRMGNFFHFIGKPAWKTKNNVEEGLENSSMLRTKKYVFSQNLKLEEENQSLKNKMLDYEILERENIEIKRLLNRIESPSEYFLARVLVKPNKSPYDTIVIDIGKDKELYYGEKVFVLPNFPIGEIVEIYKDTALVKLYSSPDEVTSGEIDIIGASVDLIGRGGGNFEMTIPKDLSVEAGVSVVVPGLNSKILATVVDTISETKDPTNKIILKTPVNISELKWVQVLR